MTRWAIDLSQLPPEMRGQAAEQLQKLKHLRERNPLAFIDPHPKQREFLASKKPIKAFLGGNRSGKTWAGLMDDIIQALDWEMVPEHLRIYKRFDPPFECRIIAPDYEHAVAQVLFRTIKKLCPRDALKGGSFAKGLHKESKILEFANDSIFEFMTYKQDLDQFGGTERHRIHYDEEPPEAIRKECQLRLLSTGGDEIFTMTPLHGMSWMFNTIYEKGYDEPTDNGNIDEDICVVVVDMDDNPHLSERTKTRVLKDYSNEELEARKKGRFVHFAGLIYGNQFKRSEHIIPQQPVPEGVNVYCAIDPGQQFAAAVVWAWVDSDSNFVVFDELYEKDRTAAWMCEAIRARNTAHGIEPRWYVIDPSAQNRNHQTGRSDQMEYADNGIITIPGQNAVLAGISRVKMLMEASPPRFYVTANCTELVKEIGKYRWKSPSHLPEADQKDRPIKRDDHLLDAMRYLVMSRPIAPEKVVIQEFDRIQQLITEDIKRSSRPPASEYGPGLYG